MRAVVLRTGNPYGRSAFDSALLVIAVLGASGVQVTSGGRFALVDRLGRYGPASCSLASRSCCRAWSGWFSNQC